ncbi:uncharacterized protein LOC110718935 [Chenopodium quinoa]|uniref:uncharacterized protein LOC110718935 n=1 Tax=Chenopodium quinoa TaxID=63459 RepID=UPI000B7905F4|nr:uncharacterized protein LOC110718935 [Chenopodium quinoa]
MEDNLEYTFEQRLAWLEGKSEQWAFLEERVPKLEDIVIKHDNEISILRSTVDGLLEQLNCVQALADEALDKCATMHAPQGFGGSGGAKIKPLKPQTFDGARDSKQVDNFIFDMEQYFRICQIEDPFKVDTATMYLVEDAKLWWRTKYADIQAKRITLDSWEDLKKEIKNQFCPDNTEFVARTKLTTLHHKTSIREYVKEYCVCMLEIQDMSEKDRLFNFVRGLKDWAQREIWRQKIDTLAGAIAAAEKLMDYSPDKGPNQKKGNNGQAKSTPRSQHPASQVSSNNDGSRYNKIVGDDSRRSGASSSSSKGSTSTFSTGNRPLTCILCRGPHKWFECRHKGEIDSLQKKLSAMTVESKQTEEACEVEPDEEEPSRLGAVHMLYAMGKEEPEERSKNTELMYVEVLVNGRRGNAMIDTGATHNFISQGEARRLGLKLIQEGGSMKAVNSAAKPVHGVARNIPTKLGDWSGNLDFTIATMDDFNLVLGMDFLRASKAVPMPHLGSVLVAGQHPCLLKTCKMRKGSKGPLLSAMQLKKGLKRNEPTFLATLSVKEDEAPHEIPAALDKLLTEFEDLLPKELPNGFLLGGLWITRLNLFLVRGPLLEALTKKQDGSLRLCIDYRALNKVTVRNHYPIPLVADLFDQLGDAVFFTKLDLKSGYHQVRIAQGDEPKTACVTRYGAFEWLVMPFGLTNAPATFYTLMNQVFHEFLDKFVVVYLDDIVIYSKTFEEHLDHLRKVFEKLQKHHMFVKQEKCAFAQEEVGFLGHFVGKGRIRMNPKKIQAIQDWKDPRNTSELRSFLGLANYYRRFIKGYSELASPLTDLLQKDRRWEWSEKQQKAFQELKDSVMREPVLALPNPNKPFEVETDASDFALGGVLLQDGHPIAFESRKLNSAERKYAAQEKELLAIVHCLRGWRHYLLGSKFIVRTDNTAATHFLSQPKLTGRQARWQESLAEFDVEFAYRTGASNRVADALSRRADLAPLQRLAPLTSSNVTTSVRDQVKAYLGDDPMTGTIKKLIEEGKTRRFWMEDGLVYTKGKKLFISRAGGLRKLLLRECHDTLWAGHPGWQRTLSLLSTRYY